MTEVIQEGEGRVSGEWMRNRVEGGEVEDTERRLKKLYVPIR